MTISTTNINKSYSGNGSTHSFAYDFPIFADADLTVVVRSAAGTETVKTLNTHYIVTGAGASSGGNVLFKFNTGTSSDAHFSATDHRPASGETVVIRSELANTQTLDLVANDPFPASAFETALDKLVRMVQQHEEELDRSIKLSRTNTMTSTEFTTSSTDRASKVLAFDSSGELSVTTELGTFKGNWSASTAYALRDIVKDTSTNNIFIAITAHTSSGSQPLTTNTDSAKWSLLVDAASATTSASAAASSATAAAASAVDATNNGAAQVTLATTQATNSSNSATASANSATASANSATAAASSATSAASSLSTFQGQYHGATSSDPTSTLDAGDLYFNTSTGVKVYDGSAWVDVKPSSSEQTAITAVNANASNINALAATDVLADMALLADADVISDMNTLATADIVADLNTLATSDIVSDINTLATSDIVSDLNTLATSDIVSDINTLATSDIVSDLNTLATSDFVADLNTMASADVVADLNTLAAISSDITSLSGALEKTYTVTVTNPGSGNVFVLDGSNAPTIELFRGNTYVFDQSDNSNTGHPIAFKDSGGSAYTTGVTATGTPGSSGAKTTFVVPSNAPSSLRYYCTVHGNSMGNTITVTDSNISLVAGSIANVNLTGGSISNVNTVAGALTNINTTATNISGVNSFAERYRVGSSDPTSSLDEGDLAYNSTANQLKYYDGTAWQGIAPGISAVSGDSSPSLGGNLDVNGNSIVSASNGNIAITPNGSGSVVIDGLSYPQADGSAGQFLTTDGSGALSFGSVPAGVGGSNGVDFNDNVKARFGTGNDLEIYHDGSNSFIAGKTGENQTVVVKPGGTGSVLITNSAGDNIITQQGDAANLHYDGVTKIATTSTGIDVTGDVLTDTLTLDNSSNDWQFSVSGNNLIISYGGTSKAKLDSSGNLTVVGNVTAYGSI